MTAAQHGTVIVTGSSGFIGAALINKLSSDCSLVGFDRMASSAPPPAAECVCIDLTSEDAVKAAFERVHVAYGDRIASVVHLAAYYDLSGEPSPLYEQITVRGTERLLEHLQGFEVEQFIFSSTMLVHTPTQPGQTINEDSPIDPRWAYPQSKVETEALIREKHGNFFGYLVARYLAAYQLGHVGTVWEPFFSGDNSKNGTEYIITSDVSRAWPIPDAGLGATSYMIEALMGAMGTATRWRTMPWMVTFF